MSNRARQLISDEIDRVKAQKQACQDRITALRANLDTEKNGLDGYNSQLQDLKDAFKQLGGDGT